MYAVEHRGALTHLWVGTSVATVNSDVIPQVYSHVQGYTIMLLSLSFGLVSFEPYRYS